MGLADYENTLHYDIYNTSESAYKIMEFNSDIKKNQLVTSALSYNGAEQKAYLDGVLKQEAKFNGKIGVPTENTVMAIGVNPYADTSIDLHFANMKVYVARIYNRALSQEEIEINNNADKRRFVNNNKIPIYTEEQLLKMGTNEDVYIAQENKTYKFETNAIYELKNDIELSSSFSDMAEKIKNGQIELQDTEYKIIENNSKYYTEASQYCIATNKYGYISDGIILYYDAIENTGSGHSSTTSVWKDISRKRK